jgi:very-short-patch-repair endonuclease
MLDAMIDEKAALALAARQGGWITRAQATERGFTTAMIRTRLRSGRWESARNAYRLIEMDEPEQRVRAACAVLPGAVASHHSAAVLHGLRPVADDMAVVTVPARTTHVFPEVDVRRTDDLAPRDRTLHHGALPVTTASRTIVDLAADCSVSHLAEILRNAVTEDLVTRNAVRDVFDRVARRGKPGVGVLRSVLGVDGGSRGPSPLEVAGIRALSDAGLDGFHTEYPIPWSPSRRFDVAFPAARVAVEWDSLAWHSDPDTFETDRRRDRDAALRGWRVVRFTWNDLERDPGRVARQVEELVRRSARLEHSPDPVVR